MLVAVVTCLSACSKENISPARDYYQLDTHSASNVVASGATFSATILNSGTEPIIEHGFVWAKTKPHLGLQTAHTVNLGQKAGAGNFTADVQHTFDRNAVYYVRPFVKTGTTLVYGQMISFKAP